MLKVGMYVRCPVDSEDMENPRDFALAKVIRMDELSNQVTVHFYDCYQIRQYYQMPEEYDYPIRQLQHAKIHENSEVIYQGQRYFVKIFAEEKDELFYYFISSSLRDKIVKVSETELQASFNDSEISPYYQMIHYEFQNPIWFFGRRNVSRTMSLIENAIRGFKELSGCKIYLKPYQLKTVMRCLQQKPCRNMIADEVGLGKTIEAASVLKIYMTDTHNAKIVILVPDALTEQWKTELAFKFNIFEKADKNGNRIKILPFSRIPTLKTELSHDFLIVDEVHQCLYSNQYYERVAELSRNAKNVLMLSATLVQDRKNEYFRLLKLIQPDKYGKFSEEKFSELLELQNKIVRNIYEALGSLEDYCDEIEDADGELSDDAQDIYEDELAESFEKISELIHDEHFNDMIQKINIHSKDCGISQMQTMIAYISEYYQLERCIIRNRRSVLDEDARNQRKLIQLPYGLDSAHNNTQLQIYRHLSEWIEQEMHSVEEFRNTGKNLISAFFSSASAFYSELDKIKMHSIPEQLQELAKRWKNEELHELEQISVYLQSPYEYSSRMVRILDYIDQEAYHKKVLLFTNFPETFQHYEKALSKVFKGKCCFFRRGMNANELELQTYRFQTDSKYLIMLSDESGGEGRNFQKADILIHIDLPWNANTLEQRIGRLDRIGRDCNRPVISVVPFAEETLEEDLFQVWNKGLHIFEQSQNGLEIIMNEIDEKILQSVSNDMKYGLSNMIPQLMDDVKKLKETVKKEQHFDTASYQYQVLNQQLDRVVRLYAENETELFASSMLGWADMTGFRGKEVSDSVIRFDRSSFSVGSTKHTHFVPPDMKSEIEQHLNQMQNHVRQLNGEREIAENPYFIQGTFNRTKALSNDYLHFFAPGDAIFDSVVQNALYSYKGRCSAIAIPATFNWNGFLFTWQLSPNRAILLENGIDLRMLGEYLGYLSQSQLTNSVALENEDLTPDEQVVKFVMKLSKSDLRKQVEHLGRRKPKSPILGIREKYGCSDLEWFKKMYPVEQWRNYVKESYQQARKEAIQLLAQRTNLRGLRIDLENAVNAQKVAMNYYIQEDAIEEVKRTNDILLQAFQKPKIELDSICFVRMVKCS